MPSESGGALRALQNIDIECFTYFPHRLGLHGVSERLQDAVAKQQQHIADEDDAYCRSIGLNLGTDQYAQCRMLKTQLRQQAQAQAAANSTAMLATAGALMAAQPAPVVQPLPNILPQQTRCQTYGATTN